MLCGGSLILQSDDEHKRMVFHLSYAVLFSQLAVLPTIGKTIDIHSLNSITDLNSTITARNIVVSVPKIVISQNSITFTDIVIDAEEVLITPIESDAQNETESEMLLHEGLAYSVNSGIHPCDDFYEYVCYNWPKSHPVKEYELRSNQMSVNVEKVNAQLLDILNSRMDYGKERVSTMLYDAYHQCVNSKQRNELRSQPLFDALSRVIRNANFRYITDWLIYVQPISLFYKIDVGPNFKNPSYNTLFLNSAGTFFTYYYYIEPQYVEQLAHIRSYLTDLLKILRVDDQDGFLRLSDNDIKRRVQSFVDVEMSVAKILNCSQRDDGRSNADRSNLQPVEKLQEIAPSVFDCSLVQISGVNFLLIEPDEPILIESSRVESSRVDSILDKKKIGFLLPQVVLDNITIEELTFEIDDADTVTRLEALIQHLPNDTLADYLEWKIILNYAGYLDDRYLNLKLDLDRILYGVQAQQPREFTCISDVASFFSEVVSALYVKKHFPSENREMVRNIVDSIRHAYVERLNRTQMMDEDTRKESIQKVHDMIEFVGFSDHIFDSEKLRAKYKDLSFNSSMTYMDIIVGLGKWNTRTSFALLIEQNTRDKFDFMATDVNAFYDPSLNQIALLAGILQGAYFNKSLPPPMNYGAIGVVIGHEMMHGFDDAGNEYDRNGSRRTWFDSFQGLRQCFVEQYSKIQVLPAKAIRVNGEQTARENIADNGGVRAAYAAMMNVLQENDIDPRRRVDLERIGTFTMEQLFFISYAYVKMCKSMPQSTETFRHGVAPLDPRL
uniref:Peptidase_M13 domain-containing protein n=1 Tax=Steinernema glaseri TaxID=37863 RepID=A0A1I7ZIN2_9BILA